MNAIIGICSNDNIHIYFSECHDTRDPKTVWEHSSPFNFLLTTVNGINSRYNHSNTSTPMCSIGITDIFSPGFGELMETAQFNYCMDVNWFMQQIPEEKRYRILSVPVYHIIVEYSSKDF